MNTTRHIARKLTARRALLGLAAAAAMLALPGLTRADTCLWEGHAPACNGECRPGYTLTKRDKSGDGSKCITGTKAYCCLTSDFVVRGKAPACNGKCKEGEEMAGDSDYGENGKKCITGHAALCRLTVK